MTRLALLFSAALALRAQDAPRRTKAADYPAHVQMDRVTLAAGYLAHSLPTAQGTLAVNGYLIVEAAFFGPPFSRLQMSPDQFTLRIDRRGAPLAAQLPGLVAASIKFPDAKAADQPITLVREKWEQSIDARVQNASLPEGEKTLPRSGLLYFAWRGNVKKIHSLELRYDGPVGKATLTLLP